MERETWKNMGVVGAFAVALGCGGMWYFGGEKEPAPVAPAPRPGKVVAELPAAGKPKAPVKVATSPKVEPVRPTWKPDDTGGRNKKKPRSDDVKKSRIINAA